MKYEMFDYKVENGVSRFFVFQSNQVIRYNIFLFLQKKSELCCE